MLATNVLHDQITVVSCAPFVQIKFLSKRLRNLEVKIYILI